MFGIEPQRVSNVCSGGPAPRAGRGGIGMELALKVILVGYVLYAVLGAPMLTGPGAAARERRT